MKILEQHPIVSDTLAIIGTFIGATTIMLFAWNSFAPDVLGLEAIRFKQALGLTLLILLAGRALSAGRGHYALHRQSKD